jgi:hypothetical protein
MHRVGYSDYMRDKVGTARIDPAIPIIAGQFASLALTYTAGPFGVDDTGGFIAAIRTVTDMAPPQFRDPAAPNYCSVEASNGAVLDVSYDVKATMRPWDRTIRVRVVRGFLRPGETITLRLGDTQHGSPGIRMQTFAEPEFTFRVLADPFATLNWIEVPQHPTLAIVPGPSALWKAVIPTLRGVGETFTLGLKAEDWWGNPTGEVSGTVRLSAEGPLNGLPATVALVPGQRALRIEGLSATAPGIVRVMMHDEAGTLLCRSNPLRVEATPALKHFWADLHGQSGETIGTNSAADYVRFARDLAFLDVISHQGNDFQITKAFWKHLNDLAADADAPGRFVFLPGWEWSGNTALGGDRNVLYLRQDEKIHRSCHILVEDLSDAADDAHHVRDLFAKLKGREAIVLAHVGGRYADLAVGHDPVLEPSVEVHSDWGTFEWLLEDAFAIGARVGIVAGSDGHKGRPGASHPGAGIFGAHGGLTCLLLPELDRAEVFAALKARRHFCTTGSRMAIAASAAWDRDADLFDADPAGGVLPVARGRGAIMGAIVQGAGRTARFSLDVLAASPIERIELRDRMQVLEVFRPYTTPDLGARIRIIVEGSEYRGRGRQTFWDGTAELQGNAFAAIAPINYYNRDKVCLLESASRVRFNAVTTGGFMGFEARLEDARAGVLQLRTTHANADIALADIGLEDMVLDAGGLARRVRLFRLPDADPPNHVTLTRELPLAADRDSALYACVTTLDGHRAWTSPIHFIP